MAWTLPTWPDIARALGYSYSTPVEPPQIGGASVSPAGPTFDPHASMAAFATFPWVRACINAIADDLSGVPLRLTRGDGPDAEVVTAHPLLGLLAQPTTTMDRTIWERQLITYWLPTGTATILIVGGAQPVSLKLLHPESVRPIMDDFGELAGVEFSPRTGAERRYFAAESIAMVSATSWMADNRALVGEGMISALVDDLNAERGAAKLAAKQANRGRPEAIISPAGDMPLTKEQREQIAASYGDFAASGKPAFVLSGAIKAEFPHFTLRDMEFGEQRKLTRETVLGLFGVPPARVGLPNTNYATAKQQDQVYWQGLVARAAVIDAALTRIARRFDPAFRVSHDFSSVPALQESRDARLQRVVTWKLLGATSADAAAYEGFADAPVSDVAEEKPPAAEEAPAAKASILHLFRSASSAEPEPAPVATLTPAPVGEEQRAAVWTGWVEKVHGPAETALAVRTRRALSKQSARVIARLDTMPIELAAVHKDLVTDIMGWLFPAGEADAWGESMRAALRDAIQSGYRDGADQLGKPWTMDASAADAATEARLAEFVSFTDPATKAKVRAAVQAGIDAGEGVNGIGLRVQESGAFSPSRALLIARTETTRSLSAGHNAAYGRYADVEGVSVRKQWLSARDRHVRDAHAYLDGQERAVGEAFVVPAGEHLGATADGPGGFASAALCVACRCTTVPLIEAS